MRKLSLIASLFLIGILHISAYAQIVQQATINIVVPTVLDLEFSSGPNPSANFTNTTLVDAGIPLSNGTILTYKSNQAFHVTINAGAANFTSSSPTPMPASVIQYRLHGSGSYAALSTTPGSLDGTSGSPITRGTANIAVDFLLDPGYIYDPATYTMSIIYTISNP